MSQEIPVTYPKFRLRR